MVERQSSRGNALFYTYLEVEYTFWAEDGSSIVVGPVIGESMDSGDKGANKALAVAHKYALFQTFTIPTLFSDPDAETHEVKPAPSPATDEQLAKIQDFIDADLVPEATVDFLSKNQGKITESQAARLLEKLNKGEGK